MRRPCRYAIRQCEQGSVAVEAAVCMAFILLPLILFIFLFGRFFWYYTAAQKSVHDAALYMATAPLSEIRSNAAATFANEIMTQEISDFGADTSAEPSSECGYKISSGSSRLAFRNCSSTVIPDAVQSSLILVVPMPFFFESEQIELVPIAVMRYAGK